MSYRKYTVPQLDSKTGFDKAAKDYHQYRKHLDSVDGNRFLRFLPRSLEGLTIADVGVGDGRVFSHFQNSGFGQYMALDISSEMLDRFRASNVQKICADCSDDIPLESDSVDLILSFFFFEYIATLREFFDEAQRVLKPGGQIVATYFYQRHSFVRGHGDEAFKVDRTAHTYDEIRDAAEYAFFSIEEMPILEQGKIRGYIYVFTK